MELIAFSNKSQTGWLSTTLRPQFGCEQTCFGIDGEPEAIRGQDGSMIGKGAQRANDGGKTDAAPSGPTP